MIGFLARRFANYLLLTLVASFAAFCLASLTFRPLDQLKLRNPPPPQSVIDAKAAELHLDQPIPQRFLTWIDGVIFHGDFGRTIADQPLTDELFRRVGVSLRLFLLGMLIGVTLGVLVGVVSAIKQYKIADYLATAFSFVALSTPVFVIATMLKAGAQTVNDSVFGYNLLIVQGESSGVDAGFFPDLLDRLQHLVVPTLAIVLTQIAYFSRYQRSAMLDVLGSDFLRTAQAKGLTRRKALFKHGLRTALIPMATLFAFGFGLLITGGIFTERIFGWYGMGDWLITGIQKQDTNIVTTVTLFIAICVLFAGWLSDVLYGLLDPRVRI